MKEQKKEHTEAARCIQSTAKLNIALEESTEQAIMFMAGQDWDGALVKLGKMKSQEQMEDIERIIGSYLEAYRAINKTQGSERLLDALKRIDLVRGREDEDDPEDTKKSTTEVVKGSLAVVDNCGETANNCLLASNPLGVLMKGLQVSVNPGEDSDQAWFWINRVVEGYGAGKTLIREEVELVTDFIAKFSATGEAKELTVSGGRLARETKRYKFVAKMRTSFSTIASGFPTDFLGLKKKKVGLFDWVSSKKTSIKKGVKDTGVKIGKKFGILDDAGKAGIKTALKNSKLGLKITDKITQPISEALGKEVSKKLGGKTLGATLKVASKVTLGLVDVGLSVWELYENVNQFLGENEEAKKFKEAANKLDGLKKTVNNAIEDRHEECTKTQLDLTCTWSKWSPRGECQPYSRWRTFSGVPQPLRTDGVETIKRVKDVKDGSHEEAFKCPGVSSKIMPCGTDHVIEGPGWIHVEDFSEKKDRVPPLRGFLKMSHPSTTTSRKRRSGGSAMPFGGRAAYKQVKQDVSQKPTTIVFVNMGGKGTWVMKIQDEVHATCSDKSKCPFGKWTSV